MSTNLFFLESNCALFCKILDPRPISVVTNFENYWYRISLRLDFVLLNRIPMKKKSFIQISFLYRSTTLNIRSTSYISIEINPIFFLVCLSLGQGFFSTFSESYPLVNSLWISWPDEKKGSHWLRFSEFELDFFWFSYPLYTLSSITCYQWQYSDFILSILPSFHSLHFWFLSRDWTISLCP